MSEQRVVQEPGISKEYLRAVGEGTAHLTDDEKKSWGEFFGQFGVTLHDVFKRSPALVINEREGVAQFHIIEFVDKHLPTLPLGSTCVRVYPPGEGVITRLVTVPLANCRMPEDFGLVADPLL